MLTKRQNLLETINGGNPDRFVNQFEAFGLIFGDPIMMAAPMPTPGGPEIINAWGVTYSWPEGVPGSFPVHGDKVLLKDITKWQDIIKAPTLDYPQEKWDAFKPTVDAIDRDEVFVTAFVAPGIFEQLHHFQGVDNALMNFYEEPEATKELIEFLVDYEVKYAKLLCENYKPDALLHHDDWGSYRSSFLSPEMFEEFILPAYDKIYGTYKENGVEVIVHHSDSYAANLVPYMIEMGMDIFQGCTTTNDVPSLVKKYSGQISFMGDLDNGVLDKPDWTREFIEKEVRRACENNGKHYFIPCLIAGGPGSTYPGVYETVSEEIDRMSKELF